MDGFISINKPVGINSTKVLSKVKGLLRKEYKLSGDGAVRVGHLGTLDPDADGVLVVSIGKATRLFDLFKNKFKTYQSIFKFGLETDTLDSSGKVLQINQPLPNVNNIKSTIKKFIGSIYQVPPLYSAVWVNGKRSYELARNNIDVTLKEKQIEIKSFKLLKQISNSEFLFEIVCSSGTYIRSLCRDLAKSLSTCAITTSITRTRCGIFDIDNSLNYETMTLADIKKKLVKPSKLFQNIESIVLSKNQIKTLVDGLTIENFMLKDGIYFVENEGNDELLVDVLNGKIKIKLNLRNRNCD